MLGVQHQVNDALQVRAGYNYGRSPVDDQHIFANTLLPATVEHHFTLGLNYALSDAFDLGWSGYVTTENELTAPGTGNGYDQMGAGAKISHRQYGTQVSVKYNF